MKSIPSMSKIADKKSGIKKDSLLAIFYDRSITTAVATLTPSTHHPLCKYYSMAACRCCRKPPICLQSSGSVLRLVTPLKHHGVKWLLNTNLRFIIVRGGFLYFFLHLRFPNWSGIWPWWAILASAATMLNRRQHLFEFTLTDFTDSDRLLFWYTVQIFFCCSDCHFF